LQMKGMKLLLWAAVLTVLLVAVNYTIYGQSTSLTAVPTSAPDGLIPTYPMALERHLAGQPYPLHVRWIAVIAQFLVWLLNFTIFGHRIIAIARMAGFDALPNTDRPLRSTSIAEYYNRV